MKNRIQFVVIIILVLCINVFNISYLRADNVSTGELNDYLTDKLADMADNAHDDLLELANIITTATETETSNVGAQDLGNMIDSSGNIKDDNIVTGIITKLSMDSNDLKISVVLMQCHTRRKYLYFCYADTQITRLVISAYESQSICDVISNDSDYYESKEIHHISIKRPLKQLRDILILTDDAQSNTGRNRSDDMARDNGYDDWNDMANAFNKFGMGESMNGLTAGSPIKIQAEQNKIQTKVDCGTSISKAKSAIQKKIGQELQSIGQ